MRNMSEPVAVAQRAHRHARAVNASLRVHEALARAIASTATLAMADPAAMTVERARVPIAPVLMARSHPGGPYARQQAHALYERCLSHYRELVCAEDGDGGCDDVGAAAARFVAANIGALQGVHATAPMLSQLARQLGAIVRLSPAWAAASARDRQAYVERLAIVSVLVSECSAAAVVQGPVAIGSVRHAARGYLQQLLGLKPELLTLGPDGLRLLAPDAAVGPAPPALCASA